MADCTVLPALLGGGWRDLRFEPFREGIEISRIDTGEPEEATQAAVLRYAPGASVPWHLHAAAETIVVLEGGQRDERGHYPAGSVVINHPGSRHSVSAPEGCVVLVVWSRPVVFVEPPEAG